MCGTVVPLYRLCFANDLNTVLLYAAQGETMSSEWLAILGISGGALCVFMAVWWTCGHEFSEKLIPYRYA